MEKTKEVIYQMLIESTGQHMLDSGGAYGRHWEKNQTRSLEDFENDETHEFFDTDTEYPYRVKSLFHHLVDSCDYLEAENKRFNDWINEDKYSYKNPEGRCPSSMSDAEDYMSMRHDKEARTINTYNGECDLSQTIQFVSVGDTYDCDVIALSIHNGCDVRGGYTDYKLFRIEEDYFYDWYLESDYIIERLEEEKEDLKTALLNEAEKRGFNKDHLDKHLEVITVKS